jgi:hypothetical protein
VKPPQILNVHYLITVQVYVQNKFISASIGFKPEERALGGSAD